MRLSRLNEIINAIVSTGLVDGDTEVEVSSVIYTDEFSWGTVVGVSLNNNNGIILEVMSDEEGE